MLVLALGLTVFRSIYLDSVPSSLLPHDAAAVLYDTIVRFLRAGLRTGSVGVWVHANRRALRIAAVALASLALVFWTRPTGQVVIGLALALLVVLAMIEFLARPGQAEGTGSISPR